MKFKNNYSIEVFANTAKQETKMVWYFIENIKFLQKYGYRLALPQNDLIPILIERSKKDDLDKKYFEKLSKLISEKIYNKNDYSAGINNIKKVLPKIKGIFSKFEGFHRKWDFKIFKEYKLFLTLYGAGGSYEPDKGEITILTSKTGEFKRGINPIGTIIHEFVHIGIEERIIQKYNILQIIKERIVDKFVSANFKDILPNYFMQNFDDRTIDKYLKDKNCWNNLPYFIEKYVEDLDRNKGGAG